VPVPYQAFFNITILPEWSLAFDMYPGSSMLSYFSNILHVRGESASERYPKLYFQGSRRKLHVSYGPSSYVSLDINGGNPAASRVYAVDITLRAGKLTMTIDNVVHSSKDVSGVCAGGCGVGEKKTLYFCSVENPAHSCANTQIRHLRYGPAPPLLPP